MQATTGVSYVTFTYADNQLFLWDLNSDSGEAAGQAITAGIHWMWRIWTAAALPSKCATSVAATAHIMCMMHNREHGEQGTHTHLIDCL